MKISDVLRGKGDEVFTIAPETTVKELIGLLAEHKIGAAVVSSDGESVLGIVSERDVVRRMVQGDVLEQQVEAIMTREVHSCAPGDEVDQLAGQMTQWRIRHVPVLVDDKLVGLVSIGDVVKSRIDELTHERDHLQAYIHT